MLLTNYYPVQYFYPVIQRQPVQQIPSQYPNFVYMNTLLPTFSYPPNYYSPIVQPTIQNNSNDIQAVNLTEENRNILTKYSNNPDFNELSQSKFFSGEKERNKLLSLTATWEKQKEQLTKQKLEPGHIGMPNPYQLQDDAAELQIPDCHKYLNKFLKSKYSDDLKQYVINIAGDLVFMNDKLKYIETLPNDMINVLSTKTWLM